MQREQHQAIQENLFNNFYTVQVNISLLFTEMSQVAPHKHNNFGQPLHLILRQRRYCSMFPSDRLITPKPLENKSMLLRAKDNASQILGREKLPA